MGELGSQRSAGLGAISEALHYAIIVHRSSDRQIRTTVARRRVAFYPAIALFISRQLVLLLGEFSRVYLHLADPGCKCRFSR